MKKMDCFRACRYSNRMVIVGVAAAVIGCVLGTAGVPRLLAGILVIAGFAVLLAGFVIGYRFLVCPHCGVPLYDSVRLPDHIPSYCPSCGAKLEPPMRRSDEK